MTFNPIDFFLLLQLVGVVLGLTYVITGSVIGYRIRLFWCGVFYWRPLRGLWPLVQCPPCNAWWAGAFVTAFTGLPLINIVQVAFTCCGVVALLQAFLGGSGIAADEDMDKILGEFYGKETE